MAASFTDFNLHDRPTVLGVESGTSASGAVQTVSTPVGGVKQILGVYVTYSAAATVNVTVTLNSILLAAYDFLLDTMALSAATQDSFVPTEPLFLQAGDVLDVFAPLLAAQTSQIAIYYLNL